MAYSGIVLNEGVWGFLGLPRRLSRLKIDVSVSSSSFFLWLIAKPSRNPYRSAVSLLLSIPFSIRLAMFVDTTPEPKNTVLSADSQNHESRANGRTYSHVAIKMSAKRSWQAWKRQLLAMYSRLGQPKCKGSR